LSNIVYRQATLADVERCFEIETTAYEGDEAATREKIATRIQQYPEGFLCMERQGEVIGFINSGCAWEVVMSDEAFISVLELLKKIKASPGGHFKSGDDSLAVGAGGNLGHGTSPVGFNKAGTILTPGQLACSNCVYRPGLHAGQTSSSRTLVTKLNNRRRTWSGWSGYHSGDAMTRPRKTQNGARTSRTSLSPVRSRYSRK